MDKTTSSPEWPRCATCRFWTPISDWAAQGLGLQKCTYAEELWEATKWSEDANRRVLQPEHAGRLAFANDGSSYHADLMTMANFGCVAHEPSEAAS